MGSRRAEGLGKLLMKFDQFCNLDLEHGFATVVSAEDAELSF
jgi:hypothetical protein